VSLWYIPYAHTLFLRISLLKSPPSHFQIHFQIQKKKLHFRERDPIFFKLVAEFLNKQGLCIVFTVIVWHQHVLEVLRGASLDTYVLTEWTEFVWRGLWFIRVEWCSGPGREWLNFLRIQHRYKNKESPCHLGFANFSTWILVAFLYMWYLLCTKFMERNLYAGNGQNKTSEVFELS